MRSENLGCDFSIVNVYGHVNDALPKMCATGCLLRHYFAHALMKYRGEQQMRVEKRQPAVSGYFTGCVLAG